MSIRLRSDTLQAQQGMARHSMRTETTRSIPLADRIASALRDEVSSKEIADLIKEAKNARSEAETAHEAAYAQALDLPLTANGHLPRR
jgi:hypothetical protein